MSITDEELNAAVAKRLGWTNIRMVKPEGLRDEMVGQREKSPPYTEKTIPSYCTSIEAAWELVEKMNAEGGAYSLINDDFGHWACVSEGMQPVWTEEEGPPEDADFMYLIPKDAWADTAPRAICQAFLKRIKENA